MNNSNNVQSENESGKIAAGECPNHGVVTGNSVEWRFPNPAECEICGAKLEIAGVATEAEIQEYA